MAEASSNVSERQISWARLFHVRPETYRAAQAAIIDAHSAHPHATLWGAGATSSSDGQFFRASDRAAGRSDVNLHYGSEPGTKLWRKHRIRPTPRFLALPAHSYSPP
jgi:TnpA family transposase